MIEIYKNLYVGDDSDYLKISHREGWSALRPIKFGPGGHKSILRYTTQAAPEGPNYLVATSGKNHMALNMIDLDDPKYFDWGMIVTGLKFVKDRLEYGDKVFVGCNAGHSRGPTMGLMFLRTIGDMPYKFTKAEKIYKTLYPPFSPDEGIFGFAKMNWNNLENLLVKGD